jgi:KDO2-lipid IV(A) lauroyltransferase
VSLQRLLDWFVYFAVRVFICIVQALRIETCDRIARGLALLACHVVRLRFDVTDDNLKHVYPEWTPSQRRRLARRMWHHLILMVCEVAHVPRKVHDTNWRNYVRGRRFRELVGYMLASRPAVLVSGHFGNFELAGYITGLLGFSSFTIARPLDNPYLDRFVSRFRGAKGQFMLPKTGSAQQVQRVLEAGGTLTLLGDQSAGPKGCFVDFLGRPASCHKGLALFALTGGAPLLVCYAQRLDAPLQFEVGLEGVADPALWDESLAGIKPLTQWYNRMLEQVIRRAPHQYWWVHRRWKDTPPKRREKEKPATAAADDERPRNVA